MDILERLRRWLPEESTHELHEDAANEIERLRETLKIFVDNVKDTNMGIDENWAKTVYPLKAENQRLREALQAVADAYGTGTGIGAQGAGSWLDKVYAALNGDKK